MRKRLLKFVLVAAVGFCISAVAFAHGGGRDSYGGHNDRKHGGYHFHTGPLAGHSYASKNEAIAALQARQSGGAPQAEEPRTVRPVSDMSSDPTIYTAQERVDALTRVLIRKGAITANELSAELASMAADK